MPVNFITDEQRERYACYVSEPSSDELAAFFHLSESDRSLINEQRGCHNRLGFAIQLGTVRFIGTFLTNPLDVPDGVVQTLAKQLRIVDTYSLQEYGQGRKYRDHANKIRDVLDYHDITEPKIGFSFARWLCALCWTSTERPSVLFERVTLWLRVHKVLLPGISTLERTIASARSRMEEKLFRLLVKNIDETQQTRLDKLLELPANEHYSTLDRLRKSPTRISVPSLRESLLRLKEIRDLGIHLPQSSSIPPNKLSLLSRFAMTAKVTAITRLPKLRRLATLAAFVHCLERKAQDDAFDVLMMLLGEMFRNAERADKKNRLRTLKDLDKAAIQLAHACQFIVDDTLPDNEVRAHIFEKIPEASLLHAMQEVHRLAQSKNNVYFSELSSNYGRVTRFVSLLVNHLHINANLAGAPVLEAFNWLKQHDINEKTIQKAPRSVIPKYWTKHVIGANDKLDHRAYVFCFLDELHKAVNRRSVFGEPSWRYGDPHAGLLSDEEWAATRPMICRTLGLSTEPEPTLTAISDELDKTYRAVIANLPNNPFVRFETIKGRKELILTPLEKLEEPDSLIALKKAIAERMPQVDLPEILLEIALRTQCTGQFIHISEQHTRAENIDVSLCALFMAEACNIGIESLAREDIPALKRDRLSWVDQNYIREDTITACNAVLVAAHAKNKLTQKIGNGDIASADGMRFVVPVQTVQAGHNGKYYGKERGVTWYNMISNQLTGLNDVVATGTLRDSLILLGTVLEQQTELQPIQIMTDTGAYSDVIFGLFRLLGYRFSPRLADIGGTRFWRIDPSADYGDLNDISKHNIKLGRISQDWDDILRLVASLKLGRVSANGIMRTLQIGNEPTRLAKAIAEYGRIEKTLNSLAYIDDENRRRIILTQLNKGEGRHNLAREIFHGKRGELRQKYREGQEDQLGSLGLVLNIVVLWNTLYMDVILDQLRAEGHIIREEDEARLSPLINDHINVLGKHSFAVPEAILRGELRPLRKPEES